MKDGNRETNELKWINVLIFIYVSYKTSELHASSLGVFSFFQCDEVLNTVYCYLIVLIGQESSKPFMKKISNYIFFQFYIYYNINTFLFFIYL